MDNSYPTIVALGGQRLDQVSQNAYGSPHFSWWLALANPEHALTWRFDRDTLLIAPPTPVSSVIGDELPPWRR